MIVQANQVIAATDQIAADLRAMVRDQPERVELLLRRIVESQTRPAALLLAPDDFALTTHIALNTLAALMAEEHPERVK